MANFIILISCISARAFIARAILGAKNLEKVLDILRDSGTGISDGMSLNVTFFKEGNSKMFYNIEVHPPSPEGEVPESLMDIMPVRPGETSIHCNK